MESLETSRVDAVADDFSLIDVSASDDDFLMASSTEPDMMDDHGQVVRGVPLNQPSDSLALHKAKTGKFNLRKSLAWDSAFFTNAGVLDPEELSSIIEGTETGVKQNIFLPCIQEELSKSTDSISTFQSDNVTLESLEADLFTDVRASIQKSSKSSTMEKSSISENSGEEGSKNGCSKVRVGPLSRKMANPTSSSNKLNFGVQVPVKSSKPSSVSKLVTKPPVNRSREPSLMLPRLPKAAAGPSLQDATTKRMSVDAGSVKADAKAAGNVKGKGASSSVAASRQVDSRKLLHKTPVVSKVSTASSVPIRKLISKAPALSKVSSDSSVLSNIASPRSSRSSCDNSSSSASENVRKPQTGVIRRKTDKNVNLPSGSKIRTLSKVVEKVKSQNNESCLSAHMKSTSNLSPSISPTSSISEWSTESSSSTATVSLKHSGFNRSSPSSQDGIVDSSAPPNPHNLSRDSAFCVHGNQMPGTFGQSSKQSSTGSSVSSTRTGSAKPSGLRMPSPNIGFFDGAKAGAKNPNSSSRSRSALPSTLPRSVAGSSSPSGVINKTKLGISANKMTAAAAGTAKPKQQVTDANLKTAAHILDHSTDSKNSSAVKHIDKDTKISSDSPRSNSPKSALERNDNALEGSDVAKYFFDSQLSGEDNLASDNGSVGMSSEFLRSISPKSTLDRNNEISGASSPRNIVPGLWLEKDTEVGLQNCPSAFSELPKGNLSIPALEKGSEVAFITDGEKQVLEFASVTKGNLVASEKEATPGENVLSTVHLGKVDDCSGNPSESSKCTSVNSEIKKNNEVADREIHALPVFESVAKDDLIALEEGIAHVSSDIANVATNFINISCASPHSNMDQESRSNGSIVYSNLSPSQHIDETINLEVEHGATNEKQCSEIYILSPSEHIDETDNIEVIIQHKQDEGESVEHGASDQKQCSKLVCDNFSPSQQIHQIDDLEIIDQHKQQDGGILEYCTTDENHFSEICYDKSSLLQHIDRTDNLEVVHQRPQQDEDESVANGATDDNYCSGIGSVEIKENKAEEFDKIVGDTDNNFDIEEGTDRDVQSDAQFANLITCFPTFPTSGDGSVVEVNKSPTCSATEACFKVDADAAPYTEKSRKENS